MNVGDLVWWKTPAEWSRQGVQYYVKAKIRHINKSGRVGISYSRVKDGSSRKAFTTTDLTRLQPRQLTDGETQRKTAHSED